MQSIGIFKGKHSRGENSAESSEAHRSSDLTEERTPGTGAPDACTGAEFPEAHGRSVKRFVLRAFEDSYLGLVFAFYSTDLSDSVMDTSRSLFCITRFTKNANTKVRATAIGISYGPCLGSK